MNTLQAFWHWVDNENPSPELYADKAGDNLSELAHAALLEAERLVGNRAGAATVDLLDRVSDEEHRTLRPAFRDLSLALCAALEHMHGQVEDDYLGKRYPARPDFQTHATLPPCPACNRSPCEGSHVNCKPDRYLLENGLVGGVTLPDDTRRAPAKPGSWLDRFIDTPRRMVEHQLAMNESIFRREYLADWLPKTPPAPIPADGPLTGRRIARCDECGNVAFHDGRCSRRKPGAAPSRVANEGLCKTCRDLGPGEGLCIACQRLAPSRVMNDDGLKPLKDDEPPLAHLAEPFVFYRGKTASEWEPNMRRLEIFTCIDREGADRLRGLEPRTITIRGRSHMYAPGVLPYLRDVIQPMTHGAATNFPEADDALIAALGFR